MKYVFFLIMFLIFLFGCKESQKYNEEFQIIDNCILEKYIKDEDILICFMNQSYEIYGYTLIDTTFYRTDFIKENIKIDSVPKYVLMAFKKEGVSCVIQNDRRVMAQNRLWLIRGTDSVFTIVKY